MNVIPDDLPTTPQQQAIVAPAPVKGGRG